MAHLKTKAKLDSREPFPNIREFPVQHCWTGRLPASRLSCIPLTMMCCRVNVESFNCMHSSACRLQQHREQVKHQDALRSATSLPAVYSTKDYCWKLVYFFIGTMRLLQFAHLPDEVCVSGVALALGAHISLQVLWQQNACQFLHTIADARCLLPF